MGRILDVPPGTALDLGSGGGLPGLPLALVWPLTHWLLLDGSVRRAAFLRDAVRELGLEQRITVVAQRAEVAGRTALRSSVDAVFARSFAGPAVTAECAAPFLRRGGSLVVAEPPDDQPGRWDDTGLMTLGMQLGRRAKEPTSVQVVQQVELCSDRFPRRVGVPSKRPLF